MRCRLGQEGRFVTLRATDQAGASNICGITCRLGLGNRRPVRNRGGGPRLVQAALKVRDRRRYISVGRHDLAGG